VLGARGLLKREPHTPQLQDARAERSVRAFLR
jgi:hypothetical protein